ncbi:hypothetical protein EMCRGX_G022078 [Ephydatia muelleri]
MCESLLYIEEARDVFLASGASEAKKNAEVFGVRKNLIFERARFNSRRPRVNVRQSEFAGKQQLALKGQRDSDKEGVEAGVNRMNSKGKVAQYKNSSSSCTRCRNQHETGNCPAQNRTPQKVLEMDSVQGEVETVFLGPVEEAKSSWEYSGMAKILLYLKKITRKYEVEESWLNLQRYCEAIKPTITSSWFPCEIRETPDFCCKGFEEQFARTF